MSLFIFTSWKFSKVWKLVCLPSVVSFCQKWQEDILLLHLKHTSFMDKCKNNISLKTFLYKKYYMFHAGSWFVSLIHILLWIIDFCVPMFPLFLPNSSCLLLSDFMWKNFWNVLFCWCDDSSPRTRTDIKNWMSSLTVPTLSVPFHKSNFREKELTKQVLNAGFEDKALVLMDGDARSA